MTNATSARPGHRGGRGRHQPRYRRHPELDAGELVITSRVTISIDIRELVPAYLCDAPELQQLAAPWPELGRRAPGRCLSGLDFATEGTDQDLTARALAVFGDHADARGRERAR